MVKSVGKDEADGDDWNGDGWAPHFLFIPGARIKSTYPRLAALGSKNRFTKVALTQPRAHKDGPAGSGKLPCPAVNLCGAREQCPQRLVAIGQLVRAKRAIDLGAADQWGVVRETLEPPAIRGFLGVRCGCPVVIPRLLIRVYSSTRLDAS